MAISIDHAFRPHPETGYERYRQLHDYFYKLAAAAALEMARIEHEQKSLRDLRRPGQLYVGSDATWKQKYLRACLEKDEKWAEAYCEDMECLI